ncbi:MAG: amino acid adenylation domain-containing protein [Gammaproteobacteria bacterium]|nr:amino acid adenylation domain-containing protein [Gammaproteobacteria bacterium]
MYQTPKHLFQFFKNSVKKYPYQKALVCNDISYSYHELNSRINQFSNYLISQNIKAGDYVCVLLDRSHLNYICMLSLHQLGAIYVPIDVKYPKDRIEYILQDLDAKFLITQRQHYPNILIKNRIELDAIESALSQYQTKIHVESPNHDDCYVIYTSGTTGNPKGVSISHRNICQYISSASKVYNILPKDNIYQGFSLSFDASMEEVWMAFSHGATLVVCTSEDIRSGVGLKDFLNQHQISVLSTVPSLLALIEHDIPNLRLIILGGETCHLQQIQSWFSPKRRIINSYGPTEATVVSTYAELQPEHNITIGHPLPDYEVFIIDENLEILPPGETGELCIGGFAISKGYINLPELTDKKFISHPHHQEQKIYRSGDLAKINASNNIEFLGRMDDQVKLRGFRIELNEIEIKMCQFPGIIQAVAQVIYEPTPTLIAFYELDVRNKNIEMNDILAFLQQTLPPFMIPNHLERLDKFPLLPSGKVNKKALPEPNMHIYAQNDIVAPKNEQEQLIVDIWSSIFKNTISTHSHFFFDLGGHSLFAAQVVSKLRQHVGFEHVSIKDLYQYPSVEALATQYKIKNTHPPNQGKSDTKRHIASNLSYFFSSIGQFFGALLSISIHSWPVLLIWLYLNHSPHINTFQYVGMIFFAFLYPLFGATLMVGMKWLILGRVKPGQYPLWGIYHFRIWLFHCIEKNFIHLLYFYGTPFINLYFKAMGAKIGKDVYIGNLSRKTFGVIYDLVEIGDYSSIGLDSQICNQYIKNGYIHIGPVFIGKNCYIGNRALLKPHTIMHDYSYLDEMACLTESSTIPSHEFFTGSPAKSMPNAQQFTLLKNFKSSQNPLSQVIYLLLSYFMIISSSLINGLSFLFSFCLVLTCYKHFTPLMTIFVLTPFITLIGILCHFSVLKVFLSSTYKKTKKGTFVRQSLTYLRYWWDMTLLLSPQIGILSDTLFAQYVFRFLGMKIGKNCEIGGFFLAPIDLIELKEQAFVASSPSLAWPIIHNGVIHFDHLLLKTNSFIGNWSYIRPNEIIGQETLIGVTSLTPERHQAEKDNTGWVGIPPIFLPKREEFKDIPESFTTKPSKSLILQRVILETIRIILPFQLLTMCLVFIYFMTTRLYSTTTPLRTLLLTPLIEIFVFMGGVFLIIGFKWLLIGRLRPTIQPLWSRYIWKYDMIEYLFISFINPLFVNFFIGTVFFNLFLRLMGCKIGKKTYIGTLLISEFDLIRIGNYSSIDDSTLVQCHLYEDRIYKTSYLTIGDYCDVGISATILYDTTMENLSSLGDKSLLMKGESLPKNTNWQGSPAHFLLHQTNYSTSKMDIEDTSSLPLTS